MSPLFTSIVIVMGLLAVMGIVVGVANDAVNFLNSALGSKAAPRRVILWIAAAGILVGNPVPEEYALDHEYMERIINVALQAADEANVHGKNITPFLLAKVKELTGGESFETNVQLALNNARCAARIAAALCELKKAE